MSVPARLSIVTLGVADFARSVAFYEGLGWERCSSSQEAIAWFRMAGSYIGVFGRAELADDANVADPGPSTFDGVTLAMNVETPESVGEALAAAESAGARILKPATVTDWGGTSGYFADPDGHAWEVAHNPFFPLDAEGRITIP